MDISKTEALSILKILKKDDAEEAYEVLLFGWKQKYLSNIPPIQLIKAHIKKIERLNIAAQQFFSLDEIVDVHFNKIDKSLVLIEYLKVYQPLIMNLKLKISLCESGVTLNLLLEELLKIQFSLLKKLSSYAPIIDQSALANIKISSPSDYYQIQKELLEKEIYETEIMNYLRAELKNSQYPYSSFLLVEVLKAVKQIN